MPTREPLSVREAPRRDITIHTLSVRASTLNEDARTVEAVIATENRVTAFDMKTWSPVDEILIMRGMEVPKQIVLLDSHPEMDGRLSMDAIRGSVRDVRIVGSQLIGTLHFADDPASDAVWKMYRDGHATDVSPGIHALEKVIIPPHTSQRVRGKLYTAGARPLHVTLRSIPREVSATPVGADPDAKVRGAINKEFKLMTETLRAYLESLGLRSDANETAASEFYNMLEGDRRQRAETIRAAIAPPANPPQPPAGSQTTRSDHPPNPPAPPAQDPPPAQPARQQTVPAGATPDEATIRAEAQAAERERITSIRSVCEQDMPAEYVDQAIRENWTVDRVRAGVLDQVRGRRPAPVDGAPPTGTPAIHSRNHETDCTTRALGAGLMLREGLDPTQAFSRGLRYDGARGMYVRTRGDGPSEEMVRTAEMGDRYSDLSLVDVCREACRLDGISIPTTRRETIRAAVSGGTLTSIFTTNVSAQLLGGYQDAADTTDGWTSSADVSDFKTNERIKMGKFDALTKHGRGGTADHMGVDDSKEEYKVSRYSGMFVIDEMDIIDDRLGALDQVAPRDIGLTAAQLRPNLVYAVMLANVALADSVALFHATHVNLGTGNALAASTLEACIAAMGKQRIAGRPLNIRPRYLLVPQELQFTAAVLLKSAQRIISASSGGTYNPLLAENIDIRVDDRIGVAGVTDPATGTAHVGTATNYYLSARPGENGAKTIEVGYLRGTGRAPQLRSFIRTEGAWGVGWDVNMDIGVKALDHRAMYKAAGV